ncbi:hypothetical protein [Spongiimicrobium salis]|uniref:hypothetical protein n=1 Tax=Spongiimicrobium salis TaxID=1667022 RepID=UPI00374D91F9
MQLNSLLFISLYLLTFAVYGNVQPCKSTNSNISYVKAQTKRAIGATEINKVKFYTYRAINAIEKTRKQLISCDCNYASDSIFESLEQLKSATRTTSLDSTKIFLRRAMESTTYGLNALERHDLHDRSYATHPLSLSTISSRREKRTLILPENKMLKEKIDQSLVDFQHSLDEVINTVDCKAAYNFAYTLYRKCERQLENKKIPEAKRYYNIKAKTMAYKAIQKLEDCIR